ncbi:MAG: hypothetical protein ACRKFN_10540 [Desulfitobacterium sp.]
MPVLQCFTGSGRELRLPESQPAAGEGSENRGPVGGRPDRIAETIQGSNASDRSKAKA